MKADHLPAHDALVYDAEIRLCIPQGMTDSNYKYCSGWGDFPGMGISVIVAYDMATHKTHIYLRDNLDDFRELCSRREYIIGYNSKNFDDKLLEANNLYIQTTYDLYREIKKASGSKKRSGGYSLNNVAKVNDIGSKTEVGDEAPKLWQRKEVGRLINYCIRDVELTRDLFYLGLDGRLKDPASGEFIKTRNLFEGKYNGQQKPLEFDEDEMSNLQAISYGAD